jgi:hypothetical protein
MGWNDRLEEDPFIPSESYYEECDRYEAWMHYKNTLAGDTEGRLTSQNIDPATLARFNKQETPARQNTMSRLWARFFGHEEEESHTESSKREEDVELPF